MTRREILDYEVRASWWVPHVTWGWAQNLASIYIAWKVRRKADRYDLSIAERDRVQRGLQ
mgnify:CR=1 FL=1